MQNNVVNYHLSRARQQLRKQPERVFTYNNKACKGFHI